MFPYILILCMDLFFNYITHQVGSLYRDPVTLSRNGPPFSHLFVVDDLTLTSKATIKSIHNIHDCITLFSVISIQNINVAKSKAIFSPLCLEGIRDLIKDLFDISPSINFEKYLGLPCQLPIPY